VQLSPEFTEFDWDDGNRQKNWKTHNVAWWECEEAFFQQPLYVLPDPKHSTGEQRFYALGVTNIGRLLFLVFTRRKHKIRVISARDMSKKERKAYYEEAQEDAKA
jgi:uncharacterized DUF497 family protein